MNNRETSCTRENREQESCAQENASHSHSQAETQKLQDNMAAIGKKLLVLSGKGGVGKSTVAANVAMELSKKGYTVGLLDVDLHGPSIPRMTGLTGQKCYGDGDKIIPLQITERLKVMSIAFLLQDDTQAVIWRGPMKYSVIQKLLADTFWGKLDYLVVDAPAGTGDEPLSVVQLVGTDAEAVIVTTPQKVAIEDVRRCIAFCQQVSLPVLGIIENMSDFSCPHCQKPINVFGQDGGQYLAEQTGLELLGKIPIDIAIVASGDKGLAITESPVSEPARKAFDAVVDKIMTKLKKTKGNSIMKIAIPLANDQLCMHFGHCEQFAIISIDQEAKSITSIEKLTPPAHEPGLLPRWIAENDVNIVIAGGMGQRAQSLFTEQNIEVIVGATSSSPEEIANAYLAGTIKTGENICDH